MGVFSKVYFTEMKENEVIQLVVHRHWFDLFKDLIIVALLLLALIGSFFLLPLLAQFSGVDVRPLMLFVETLAAIFTWLYVFLLWIDYYLDVWIVTNERIVNVEQKGLFVRNVSELKISKIQDITTEVMGFIPTVLNFGDVHIQTAGEESRFLFRNVPDPYRIKGLVTSLQKQSHRRDMSELEKIMAEK